MGLSKKVFRSDLDMNKYEILQARLENLASAPGTPGLGQVYYDTVSDNFLGWDGAWKQLDATTLAESATDVTATAAELNLLDLSGLTAGWALLADSPTTASWQAIPAGATTFLGLTDVDTVNYTTQGGYLIRVNSTPDGLETCTATLANSATDVTATVAELNVLDLSATALTTGWVYAADGASAASWRQLLGSEINNDSNWAADQTATLTAGTGISGTTYDPNTTTTFNLDFSELTDMTGDISATTEFILQDGTTESRKAASEIKLSFFNNDSSWTANVGDMVLGTIQTVTAAKTFNDGTLLLDDSDSVFNLILGSTSTITTANKTLTFDVNDANRTLTITGNGSIEGLNTGDQTSIADFTGTKTEFDAACSDDNFVFDGDTSTSGWGFVIDDNTMATATATNLASSESIKAYVDNAVLGGMVYKGAEDASTAPPTGAGILVGWTYTVTVAGNGSGFWTNTLEIGDMIVSEVVNPSVEADWTVVNRDLPAGVTYKYSVDIGNGVLTDIDVSHNFGTKDVQVTVWRIAAPYDEIECQAKATDTNTVELGFNTAPTSAEFRAVVIG